MSRVRTARRRARWPIAAVMVAIAASLAASMALGDEVRNTITTDPKLVTVIAGGAPVSVGYFVQVQGGDPESGCNATAASPATVSAATPLPSGITASAPVVLTGCATPNAKSIVYTIAAGTTPGDYIINVNHSDPGPGTYTNAGGFTLRVQAPPPADTTAPVITPVISGTEGNGSPPWYRSDVLVTWNVVDLQSAITSTSGCGPTTIDADTTGVTLTCTATSAGGTATEPVTIRRDATPPTLSPTVTPASVPVGGSATAAANADGAISGLASASCDPVDTSSVGTRTVTCTATDNAGNTNTATASYTVFDPTPPEVTAAVVGTQGLGTPPWYTSDVSISWTVTDNESAITSASAACDVTTSVVTDTAGQTVTCSATSAGGTTTEQVTIRRDATPPTLNPTVSPNPVLLNGSATASPNADGAISGLASASCGPVVTSPVGAKTLTCTATDNAGNTATATASYSVVFGFAGFFQPVDNLPMLNSVKAGSSVPVKFSLGGDFGLNIMAAGYPASKIIACSATAPDDAVEQTSTAGNSTLHYDALSGQYTYVWKTEKSWAGTCRQLVVKLTDGTLHQANFKLK